VVAVGGDSVRDGAGPDLAVHERLDHSLGPGHVANPAVRLDRHRQRLGRGGLCAGAESNPEVAPGGTAQVTRLAGVTSGPGELNSPRGRDSFGQLVKLFTSGGEACCSPTSRSCSFSCSWSPTQS